MARVETIAIERNGGKVVINKSDYDPERDTLFGEKAEPKKTRSQSARKEKAERD